LNLSAQSITLSLENKGGMCSNWVLGENIEARVALETGMPAILIDETFMKENLQSLGLEITEVTDGLKYKPWGDKEGYKINYRVKGVLKINGKDYEIEAFAYDFSNGGSSRDKDMVFPIANLKSKVELNVAKNYMRVFDEIDFKVRKFTQCDAVYDELTKGLYAQTDLVCYDSDGGKKKLVGNFLFDLGSGSAFVVNKNKPEVLDFIASCKSMKLHPSRYAPMAPHLELEVFTPEKIRFNGMNVKGSFFSAMKINSTKSSDRYVGIVGNRFFERYIVIFDFDDNKVYFKPN